MSYFDEKDNETVVESLDYDICDWEKSKYTVVESYDFSWIIDLNIECDQFKVSLIGTLISVGLLLGACSYSFITKWKSVYVIYFIFAIVCVLLMIFLKETNGKPIPEQIKEIEEEENKKMQGGIPVVIV